MAQGTLSWADLLPHGITPDNASVILTGIISFLVVFLVGKTFFVRDTLTPRLKALQERRAALKAHAMTPRRRKEQTSGVDFMRRVVMRLKLLQKEQSGKLNLLLTQAGWRTKDAIYIFLFFQFVTPIAFFLVSFLLVKFDFSHPFTHLWKWLVILGLTYMGLKMPSILAYNARGKRYGAIQKSLSDTLDLMLICAEAGLSLGASLERVSRELGMAYPEMADEMGITSVELGFLPDRKRALQNLSERVGMQEIRGIVSVLIQTEKYGTPIAQALRVLSTEFRTQRMLRAEQKAARLPAIMTIPMIVFILPTLFVIVLAPAVIRLLDTWK
jgi:tight adherence protein C